MTSSPFRRIYLIPCLLLWAFVLLTANSRTMWSAPMTPLTPLQVQNPNVNAAVTTLLGAMLTFAGIDPARALYWAAVVNGVLAAPLMAVMMLIARNPRAMGRLTLSRRATVLGWCATAVMAVASLIFLAFTLGFV